MSLTVEVLDPGLPGPITAFKSTESFGATALPAAIHADYNMYAAPIEIGGCSDLGLLGRLGRSGLSFVCLGPGPWLVHGSSPVLESGSFELAGVKWLSPSLPQCTVCVAAKHAPL